MNKISTLQLLSSLGLSKEDQNNYTNVATTFSLRQEIIETPQFTEAIREIARRHRRGVEANVAEGLLLVAQTGSGKTTVLEYYASKFPPVRTATGMKIPVVRVTTPAAPSVKMLAETILLAMGDPAAASGNTTVKTNRIVHLFKSCGVELLMIDEFQHFVDGRRMAECRKVTDWVKTLIDSLRRHSQWPTAIHPGS
jgi:DNA transposition AAA+ family ATPase